MANIICTDFVPDISRKSPAFKPGFFNNLL